MLKEKFLYSVLTMLALALIPTIPASSHSGRANNEHNVVVHVVGKLGGEDVVASLVKCYDGDTCRVRFANTPALLSVQSLRFKGFDTPEIRGACDREKSLAQKAQNVTLKYMRGDAHLSANGERDRYGRLVVEAPELKTKLIRRGLAREYDGGKRGSWCQVSSY